MALWKAILSFVRFVHDATCHNTVMGKKKKAPTQAEALGIVIDHAEVPGAQRRLARAYALIRGAAARADGANEHSRCAEERGHENSGADDAESK